MRYSDWYDNDERAISMISISVIMITIVTLLTIVAKKRDNDNNDNSCCKLWQDSHDKLF